MKSIEIGKRIKQAREEKKMTQQELGEYLGLNKSSVQRYETGQVAKIKLPILENMAQCLGVNPEWLALKSDDPTIKTSEPRFRDPLDEKIVEMFMQLNASERREVLGLIVEKLHTRSTRSTQSSHHDSKKEE